MSQTKTNLRMIDIGTITPLDFGANGDGTSNDAATLQLALDSTSNSVLDLAGKTYAFESALTITRSNLTIKNGTLKFTGTNAGELRLYCEASTAHYVGLIGPAHNGATTYTLKLPDVQGKEGSLLEIDSLSGTDGTLKFTPTKTPQVILEASNIFVHDYSLGYNAEITISNITSKTYRVSFDGGDCIPGDFGTVKVNLDSSVVSAGGATISMKQILSNSESDSYVINGGGGAIKLKHAINYLSFTVANDKKLYWTYGINYT